MVVTNSGFVPFFGNKFPGPIRLQHCCRNLIPSNTSTVKDKAVAMPPFLDSTQSSKSCYFASVDVYSTSSEF